jgi:hypothetical protein
MKKAAIFGLALLLVAGISTITFADGPGYGRGYGGGQGYGMGPGAMHGGYGGGYGMMGTGRGAEGYAPCSRWEGQELGEEITKERAETFLENRLSSWGNPNLKLGKIVEKDSHFEANIVTKKGNSLVQKLQIEKKTGLVRSVY